MRRRTARIRAITLASQPMMNSSPWGGMSRARRSPHRQPAGSHDSRPRATVGLADTPRSLPNTEDGQPLRGSDTPRNIG
eukprot:15450035-Alexandrium_andersonii.AAC.1